ncbi:MAG: exodeoxyribonuclease VII large subunit [Kiritimatiellae bacterium]|nr:exodeoxyribonuclease VII large subunit [Kiritimatiellia bacterium]
MNADKRKIYRVAELTRLIKIILENEVGELWVEGEISNLRRPASGHWYFTLKDENSQVAAVMFRGSQAEARCELKDGIQARLFGRISVYEKSGQYQIIARRAEPAGDGALQAAFEALKKKLAGEGLFDQSRKKPIPLLPRHIGVVTSPSGAAIHDILNIIARRFSNLHVALFPVRVQGEGAAAEIAAAIDFFNAQGEMDVLIVGRGGGSLEDLRAFNEEMTARAVARSSIPVISAVGHETDFTICDFAADLRAPTPSAAAELVIGRKADFEAALDNLSRRLQRTAREHAQILRARLSAAGNSYVFREPGNIARQMHERLAHIASRLEHALRNTLREKLQTVDEFNLRLGHAAVDLARARKAGLQRLETLMKSMNPLAVLERGYSITCLPNGRILKSAAQTRPGERLTTRLAGGIVESDVAACRLDGSNPDD